jgi:hypothetical protein
MVVVAGLRFDLRHSLCVILRHPAMEVAEESPLISDTLGLHQVHREGFADPGNGCAAAPLGFPQLFAGRIQDGPTRRLQLLIGPESPAFTGEESAASTLTEAGGGCCDGDPSQWPAKPRHPTRLKATRTKKPISSRDQANCLLYRFGAGTCASSRRTPFHAHREPAPIPSSPIATSIV